MATKETVKQFIKERRRIRVRAKISGTKARPRLNVFRSLKHVYAQLIDDQARKTLVSASDAELKDSKGKKADKAQKVGELIAQKAAKAGIKEAVFDRAGYKFHGRVKAIAEGARSGGLKF